MPLKMPIPRSADKFCDPCVPKTVCAGYSGLTETKGEFHMDAMKIGDFLSALRKARGYTQ